MGARIQSSQYPSSSGQTNKQLIPLTGSAATFSAIVSLKTDWIEQDTLCDTEKSNLGK